MSHYKAYPAYKDSGVEWIGEVPEGWEIKPICRVASCNDDALSENTPADAVLRYVDISAVNHTDGITQATEVRFVDAPSRARRQAKSGDVVVSTVRTYLKAVAAVTEDYAACIYSTGFAVLRARSAQVDPGFLKWMALNDLLIQTIEAHSEGLSYPAINATELVKLKTVVPPLTEQSTIAAFLDRETTRIDALIAKKTRFIELLKEKRQALITRAVTKGLDPKVKMKNSGVEWIREVPEHWNIPALKRLVATPITDGPHETPVKQDEGVRFISAEAISSGRIDFSKTWGFISKEDDERFSRKYKPQKNDLYMIKSGATTGVVTIVEDDVDFNIWSPLAAIRPSRETSPRFLLYALRSSEFQAGVALNWSYGTQQNIGMRVLEALPVPIPSLNEQHTISDYLDRATDRIDSLIQKTERSITLLRERRSAFITAAVTGQLDLREAA